MAWWIFGGAVYLMFGLMVAGTASVQQKGKPWRYQAWIYFWAIVVWLPLLMIAIGQAIGNAARRGNE